MITIRNTAIAAVAIAAQPATAHAGLAGTPGAGNAACIVAATEN